MAILKAYCRFFVVVMMLIVGFASLQLHAEALEPVRLQEQKIKAGLLYNFLKYTTWPEEDFSNSDNKLTVCLLGGDSFQGALYPLVGRTAQKRIIDVREIHTLDGISSCRLVFINQAYEDDLPDLLSDAHGNHILTLSDIVGFSKKNGMVEFSKGTDQRIHLIINNGEIQNSGLYIDDRLLKLAKVVQ